MKWEAYFPSRWSPCQRLKVYVYIVNHQDEGFPGGSDSKESTSNVGDLGSIPGSGKFPGAKNDNPLQYSCLENSLDWQAIVRGVTKSHSVVTEWRTLYFHQDKYLQRACCAKKLCSSNTDPSTPTHPSLLYSPASSLISGGFTKWIKH